MCITYEFENIDAEHLNGFATMRMCHRDRDLLEITQDRIKEKNAIRSCRGQVAPYAVIHSLKTLLKQLQRLGFRLY